MRNKNIFCIFTPVQLLLPFLLLYSAIDPECGYNLRELIDSKVSAITDCDTAHQLLSAYIRRITSECLCSGQEGPTHLISAQLAHVCII